MKTSNSWSDFHQKYYVEATGRCRADILFQNNTPISLNGNLRFTEIDKITVIEKKTLNVVKEYEIRLNDQELRANHNEIKRRLIEDFHIDESLLSHGSNVEKTA